MTVRMRSAPSLGPMIEPLGRPQKEKNDENF